MSRFESVVIPFPTPPNSLRSHAVNNCSVLAAAEYRAALLAKLLRHIPQQEMASTTGMLLSELIVLYRQAIYQAHRRAEHE